MTQQQKHIKIQLPTIMLKFYKQNIIAWNKDNNVEI